MFKYVQWSNSEQGWKYDTSEIWDFYPTTLTCKYTIPMIIDGDDPLIQAWLGLAFFS